MPRSPPEEALNFRGKSLTPQSPKPIHLPSPSNIPILELQMDPTFGETFAASAAALAAPADVPVGTEASADLVQSSSSADFSSLIPELDPSLVVNAGQVKSAQASSEAEKDVEPTPASASASTSTMQPSSSSPFEPISSDAINGESHANPSLALLESFSSAPTNPINETNAGAFAAPSFRPGSVDFQALLDTLTPKLPDAIQPQLPSDSAVANALASAASEIPATQSDLSATLQAQIPISPSFVTPGTNIANITPIATSQAFPPPSQQPLQSPSVTAQSPSSNPAQSQAIPDEDGPFPPELEPLFQQFLDDERANVSEGNWEKFPDNSRLFIGNLPTEKVSKRDVFKRFQKYGALAQISLKQAYGFVQFLAAESCQLALKHEQNSMMRGRAMRKSIVLSLLVL
jgi:hypothetical protein